MIPARLLTLPEDRRLPTDAFDAARLLAQRGIRNADHLANLARILERDAKARALDAVERAP